MGNLTLDHAFYGPPEALTEGLYPRPAYVAETASGASDLAGSMAGALAASAMVVKQYGSAADAPKVTKYLAAAQRLYDAVCLLTAACWAGLPAVRATVRTLGFAEACSIDGELPLL